MPLAVEGAFCEPLSVGAAMETPGKKRKRNAETNPFLNFTDQTFSIPSSTPKHSHRIDGSAFENPSFRAGNKENYNIFSDSCMEVKSIADLAAAGNRIGSVVATSELNPFEVIRKPPKKKKKHHEGGLEESCFENPCLNLAAADKKPVNPFEVVRDGEECKRQEAEEMSRCFVNSALNIRGADVMAQQQQHQQQQPYNPFEIVRPKEQAPVPESHRPVPDLTGIENPALEVPTYAIAVPFTPSLKHRINFQELPAGALTPCHLMASMAVCSPIHGRQLKEVLALAEQETPKRNVTVTLAKRRSLSVISEESDIGEKLDCYQLELENSMNEAKAKRQQAAGEPGFTYSGTGHRRRSVRRSLIDMKHISNLSLKLRELEDEETDVQRLEEPTEEEEDKENKQPIVEEKEKEAEKETEEVAAKELKEEKTEEPTENQSVGQTANAASPKAATPPDNQITFTITKETTVREEIRIDVSNPDVQFEEVDDFEDEEQDVELMHNPAPFQRAYRKKEPLAEQPRPAGGDGFKCPASLPETGGAGKSHKVRDVIRRSFRRLIPRHQSATVSNEEPKQKDGDHEEGHGHGHGLISSIRHSLRRRQPKAASEDSADGAKKPEASDESPLEMSIIAEQPRAVYRQPALNEYKPIAANPGPVGSTLRSSLRRSTKDIRKQMMKSVFRKQTTSGDLLAGDHRGDGQLV